MWPYSWTHVGTPSHLGHMDRVAATMPSQSHAGAAQEAPDIGQWEGQDVPLVRPSSCIVKGGIASSRRYLPTYLTIDCHFFGSHLFEFVCLFWTGSVLQVYTLNLNVADAPLIPGQIVRGVIVPQLFRCTQQFTT